MMFNTLAPIGRNGFFNIKKLYKEIVFMVEMKNLQRDRGLKGGRPRLKDEDKPEKIPPFNVSKELKAAIKEAAAREDLTMVAFLRQSAAESCEHG